MQQDGRVHENQFVQLERGEMSVWLHTSSNHTTGRRSVRLVRLALNVTRQNGRVFVDVILL